MWGLSACCSRLLACCPHRRPCPQTFGPQLAAQISEPLQFVDYLREPKRDEVRLQGGRGAAAATAAAARSTGAVLEAAAWLCNCHSQQAIECCRHGPC